MSTNNNTPESADDVDARQVEDAPLQRSKDEADRKNPDVSHDEHTDDEVHEEEVESFQKWQKDETSGQR